MRLKIISVIILAGFAGLAGIYFLKHSINPQSQPPPPAIHQNQSIQPVVFSSQATSNNLTAIKNNRVVIQKSDAAANTDEAQEIYVQNHVAELQELQTKDDAQSLQAILCELTNSDKTVREAAIDATTQFGSRDAIPVLKDLAVRTQAPDEKAELLDAADFLALPSLTEVRQQNPHLQIYVVPPPQNPPLAPAQP